MTILAIFRSRAQALDCVSALRGAGVPASAVNTPKEAGVGCGLSVKFEEGFTLRVKSVLQTRRYAAFGGFMKRSGGRYIFL